MSNEPAKGEGHPSQNAPLIRPITPAMDVPVFNIVVYISHVDGKVIARVANLPNLSFSASSEPMVLKKSITEVKQRLSQWHASQETIPWIDPVPPRSDSEQERLIPVHL